MSMASHKLIDVFFLFFNHRIISYFDTYYFFVCTIATRELYFLITIWDFNTLSESALFHQRKNVT